MKCQLFETLLSCFEGKLKMDGAPGWQHCVCENCTGRCIWYEKASAAAEMNEKIIPPIWFVERASRLLSLH